MAPRVNVQEDGIWDLPITTIIVVLLIVVGSIDLLIDGALSKDYIVFVKTIAIPLAGLALGRGWAARKPG
jgi:hypothetical protein